MIIPDAEEILVGEIIQFNPSAGCGSSLGVGSAFGWVGTVPGRGHRWRVWGYHRRLEFNLHQGHVHHASEICMRMRMHGDCLSG